MDPQVISERSSSLGARLLRERELSEVSLARAASQLGVTPDAIECMESGEQSPSLPELELLSLLYRAPLVTLLGLTEGNAPEVKLDQAKKPAFIVLRTHIIGASIKQARFTANLSIEELAEKLSIPSSTLIAYESGTLPIPEPLLTEFCSELGIDLLSLVSALTPKAISSVKPDASEAVSSSLSPEMKDFVLNSANLPYLELAKKLSSMDAVKLREIAESLLEITY